MSDRKTILLIRPRNIYGINNYPALGLLSIGTVLKDLGFRPVIINCGIEKEPRDIIFNEIGKKDLLFSCITMTTAEVPDGYNILRFLRSVSGRPIIVGGWHPTLFSEQIQRSGLADYIVEGDGEYWIQQIIDSEYIRDSGRSIRINNCEPIVYPSHKVDPNELKSVNYCIDRRIRYFINQPLTDTFCKKYGRDIRWLPYESSRGCPSKCTFCANVVTGNQKFRAKNPEKAVSEMFHHARLFNLHHIKFIDDNFFVDIRRADQIAYLISCCGHRFTWDSECRVDYFRNGMIDDNELKRLRSSGLVQLTLGIESGDQNSLDLMKKEITVEQAEYAVAQCDKHKIFARCSFIVGLPGEPRSAIEKTNKLINRLRRFKYFSCGVQTFRPYPKCELTAGLIKSGHWKEPSTFHEWSIPHNARMFTSAQLERPWQVCPEYSDAVATYQTIESGVSLSPHMLRRKTDRAKLKVFQAMAKARNRLGFYGLPLDKKLYRRFHRRFFNA